MDEIEPIQNQTLTILLGRIFKRKLASKAIAALRDLIADYDAVQHIAKRRGRAKGGGQSSKAKGRTAVQKVRDLLLGRFSCLGDDDILVKATSMGGCDLHLSPLAQGQFPYGIEVKAVEALNVWEALAQAQVNAQKKALPPIVFFTRAHAPMYVALRAEDFLNMTSGWCCERGRLGQPHDCQKQPGKE